MLAGWAPSLALRYSQRRKRPTSKVLVAAARTLPAAGDEVALDQWQTADEIQKDISTSPKHAGMKESDGGRSEGHRRLLRWFRRPILVQCPPKLSELRCLRAARQSRKDSATYG